MNALWFIFQWFRCSGCSRTRLIISTRQVWRQFGIRQLGGQVSIPPTFCEQLISMKMLCAAYLKLKFGLWWKSGLVVSELDSGLEGRGFKSHPILDANSVKTMPGLIPLPNPGSFNWKELKYRQPNGAHQKILIKIQFSFVISWYKNIGTKVAHKMLVKLTTGGHSLSSHKGAATGALLFQSKEAWLPKRLYA